jgi:D-glycero-alpha-D-manno-heptose-7-phosphate kinase
VGLLHALYGLKGCMPTKHQLAMESIYIEQERVKDTVGSQDQVLAAFGGFNHIAFLPNGHITVKPMTLSAERIDELNARLMLFYTGIKRTASAVAQSYVPDIKSKEQEMRILGDLVDEGIAIMCGGQDITRFGKLLHEAWQTKRGLSSKISNGHIDDIYNEAMAAGAIGGKVMGAGGGFMLFFVHPCDQAAVRQRLHSLVYVPFRFENSGSHIIFFDREEEYAAEEQDGTTRSIRIFREAHELPSQAHHGMDGANPLSQPIRQGSFS